MVTPQVLNAYGVWEVSAGVQVFRKELYTYIHLDYVRVEFLSCIKKKKKSNFTWDTNNNSR